MVLKYIKCCCKKEIYATIIYIITFFYLCMLHLCLAASNVKHPLNGQIFQSDLMCLSYPKLGTHNIFSLLKNPALVSVIDRLNLELHYIVEHYCFVLLRICYHFAFFLSYDILELLQVAVCNIYFSQNKQMLICVIIQYFIFQELELTGTMKE